MKIWIIIRVISATCLIGYAQESPSDSEVKIIPFDTFYRVNYTKITNSDEIVGFINKCIQTDERTVSEQLFYSAGFVRGILEMSTVEKFKQNPGEVLYNMRGFGANVISEKSGWTAGCRVGHEIGAKILEAYGVYLQKDDVDREKISVSDIHIDLPHIEKDANKAEMATPRKPSD
jgi:hypothetical protein